MSRTRAIRIAAVCAMLLLVAGCAAGDNNEWTDTNPAGFFAGLWHGALLVIALIVSFFTNDVTIYEISNTGATYNLGFVLGTLIVYGGGMKISVSRPKRSGHADKGDWDKGDWDKGDWDKVAARVEANVKAKLRGILSEDDDPDWKELGEKFERKVKERLRKWLDEDQQRPADD